jgi:hypothetical protein
MKSGQESNWFGLLHKGAAVFFPLGTRPGYSAEDEPGVSCVHLLNKYDYYCFISWDV